MSDTTRAPLLSIRDLAVQYRTRSGPVDAVRGVSFDVEAGAVTALVGESGSGKTTVAQSVIGLLASNGHVSSGSIRLNERTDGLTDLVGLPERRWRHLRGRCIALIPQDPGNSLNPVATIGWSVGESLRIHGWKNSAKVQARVIDLLERVGIDDPEAREVLFRRAQGVARAGAAKKARGKKAASKAPAGPAPDFDALGIGVPASQRQARRKP